MKTFSLNDVYNQLKENLPNTLSEGFLNQISLKVYHSLPHLNLTSPSTRTIANVITHDVLEHFFSLVKEDSSYVNRLNILTDCIDEWLELIEHSRMNEDHYAHYIVNSYSSNSCDGVFEEQQHDKENKFKSITYLPDLDDIEKNLFLLKVAAYLEKCEFSSENAIRLLSKVENGLTTSNLKMDEIVSVTAVSGFFLREKAYIMGKYCFLDSLTPIMSATDLSECGSGSIEERTSNYINGITQKVEEMLRLSYATLYDEDEDFHFVMLALISQDLGINVRFEDYFEDEDDDEFEYCEGNECDC